MIGFALAHPCNCIFEIREAVILSRILFFIVVFRGFSPHVIRQQRSWDGLKGEQRPVLSVNEPKKDRYVSTLTGHHKTK